MVGKAKTRQAQGKGKANTGQTQGQTQGKQGAKHGAKHGAKAKARQGNYNLPSSSNLELATSRWKSRVDELCR